ncbi:hypothetical protein NDU88_004786, partial [Pleurodeles waltl]
IIQNKWGPLQIYLFASRLNSQLPQFYSWRPDPLALASDAFLQEWSLSLNYAFPPFIMISRVLAHIRHQQASLILITPFWQSQTWFPALLELSIDFPILIPSFPDLLLDPLGRSHPLILDNLLTLSAWKISGNLNLSRAFRQKLPNTSHGPG